MNALTADEMRALKQRIAAARDKNATECASNRTTYAEKEARRAAALAKNAEDASRPLTPVERKQLEAEEERFRQLIIGSLVASVFAHARRSALCAEMDIPRYVELDDAPLVPCSDGTARSMHAAFQWRIDRDGACQRAIGALFDYDDDIHVNVQFDTDGRDSDGQCVTLCWWIDL